eukprot:TRINITY_DN8429_c0_g1_i5.p1 TRINITY_DN8429_c0_g1~~TRINITY_DN8429_c0_g1_i5.p1  ORF type:complete len:377 (-),score=57.46 TRINITY_DN8429_c0_g1_i5:308-1438(-)
MAGVETNKRKHESDDEILQSESTKNPEKKAKNSSQTFLPRYREKYPFLIASRKGKHFAHCTLCKHDFSVRSSGIFDCKRHAQSASHKQFGDGDGKQSKLSAFLTSSKTTDGDQKKDFERSVMRAEAMICQIIADSNLSIATSDTLTTAMKAAFPDSKIAQRVQCGRSKATAVIKEMAAQTSNDLQKRMKAGPYTVSTDGSNDTDSKQFPLVIRSINADTGLVTSELLSVPNCQGSATGQNIFNLINAEFQSRRIPWENCLSLGCDSANVMTGKHKGVNTKECLHLSRKSSLRSSLLGALCTWSTMLLRKQPLTCLPLRRSSLTSFSNLIKAVSASPGSRKCRIFLMWNTGKSSSMFPLVGSVFRGVYKDSRSNGMH